MTFDRIDLLRALAAPEWPCADEELEFMYGAQADSVLALIGGCYATG